MADGQRIRTNESEGYGRAEAGKWRNLSYLGEFWKLGLTLLAWTDRREISKFWDNSLVMEELPRAGLSKKVSAAAPVSKGSGYELTGKYACQSTMSGLIVVYRRRRDYRNRTVSQRGRLLRVSVITLKVKYNNSKWLDMLPSIDIGSCTNGSKACVS